MSTRDIIIPLLRYHRALYAYGANGGATGAKDATTGELTATETVPADQAENTYPEITTDNKRQWRISPLNIQSIDHS